MRAARRLRLPLAIVALSVLALVGLYSSTLLSSASAVSSSTATQYQFVQALKWWQAPLGYTFCTTSSASDCQLSPDKVYWVLEYYTAHQGDVWNDEVDHPCGSTRWNDCDAAFDDEEWAIGSQEPGTWFVTRRGSACSGYSGDPIDVCTAYVRILTDEEFHALYDAGTISCSYGGWASGECWIGLPDSNPTTTDTTPTTPTTTDTTPTTPTTTDTTPTTPTTTDTTTTTQCIDKTPSEVKLTLLGENGGPPVYQKSAGDSQRFRVHVDGIADPEGISVSLTRTAQRENGTFIQQDVGAEELDANGDTTFTVTLDDGDLSAGAKSETDSFTAGIITCDGLFYSSDVNAEWFRVPLIFLPGNNGTYLNSNKIGGDGEAWPAAERAANDYSGDVWLKYLRLKADGVTDAYGVVTPTTIIKQINIIIGNVKYLGPLHYYDQTIENLENNGWVDHKTLFEFPYDWRKSIALNEDKLLTYIDQLRSNLCPACKIDLLAHSQGGLVASALLEDAASIGKVRRLVTLGTPLSGAPKALGILALAAPCIVEHKALGITFCPYTKNTIRDIAQNMPGIYDLLPSENLVSYINAIDPNENSGVWANNGWSYEGHSPRKGVLSYDNIYNYIRVASNANIASQARTDQREWENFRKADPNIQIERIVGTGLGTISGFKTHKVCSKPTIASKIICEYRVNVQEYVDGDGTVPDNSADVQTDASQIEYQFGTGHMKLAQDAGVIEKAASFLHNGPSSIWSMGYSATSRVQSGSETNSLELRASEELQSSPTMDVDVEGDVNGGFTDPAGEVLTDGSEDPATWSTPEISGGDFEQGVGTKLYYFNQPVDVSGEFVVKSDEPTSLTVHRYENGPGLPTSSATFFIPSVVAGEHLKLNVAVADSLSDLRLGVDKNGDGTAEVTLAPTGVNEGSAAADDIAPQTDYSETPASHRKARVSLTGSDEGGSGLAGIYYFTSGGKEGRYTRPLELKIGTTLVFYGIDAAGNYESPHTLVVDDVGNDAAHSTALNPPQEVRRTLNPASDEDWFSFSVSENHKYRFDLDREGKNAELQLLDSNSNVVAGTEAGKKHPDELTVALSPGKYYVRVYQTERSRGHKHPYELDITIERCVKNSRPGGEAHCLFAPPPKVVTPSERGRTFVNFWGALGHKRA